MCGSERVAKAMIPCKHVAELLLSDQLSNRGWWTRVQVRLHLAMCGFCSRLERQVKQLGIAARKSAEGDETGKGLEERVLRRLTGEEKI